MDQNDFANLTDEELSLIQLSCLKRDRNRQWSVKEMYAIDMEETQKPKLLDDIPEVDYLITMGCNVCLLYTSRCV